MSSVTQANKINGYDWLVEALNGLGVVPGECTEEQVTLVAQKLGVKNQDQLRECLKHPLHSYRSVISSLSIDFNKESKDV